MRNVRLLFLVVVLYALGYGLVGVGMPLACLKLGMTSEQIGFVTAGGPLGYAIGCAIFGQILRRYSSKNVLLIGQVFTIISVLAIYLSRTVTAGFVSQLGFGLAQGAVWPFASAWMLSFTEVPKTTVLRYYNVAWTGGTALGFFAAGLLGEWDQIYAAFGISIGILTLSLLASFPPHAHPSLESSEGAAVPVRMGRISFSILSAAVLGNIAVLGTRAITSFNYPELNDFYHFSKIRIGLFSACALCGQLAAFLGGRYYESYLGSRRIYAIIGLTLIGVNLCLAYVTSIEILTAAMLLIGIVAAMAFQAAIIAATGWFTSPRIGTTMHESIIGAAQMVAWLAGWMVQRSKDSGGETLTALRLPYVAMAACVAVGLLLQLILVTSRKPERILSTAHAVAEPGV